MRLLFALFVALFASIANAFNLAHCPSSDEVLESMPIIMKAFNTCTDTKCGMTWISKNKITWEIIDAENQNDTDFSFRDANVQENNDSGYVINCVYYSDGFDNGNKNVVYANLLSINTIYRIPSDGKWASDGHTKDCNVETEDGSLIGTEADCPFEVNK